MKIAYESSSLHVKADLLVDFRYKIGGLLPQKISEK